MIVMNEEIAEITKKFHDTYEKLSKDYDYETRKETRVFDINSSNGKLMYATVNEVIKPILEENQELKKHLKVPKTCSLKTLEDYKSYYEDTTREQILEDTYIEYCAYVNLAHRYSELKKQIETYEIEGYKQNEELDKMSFSIRKYKIQQKEFIKYMNDIIEDLETEDVDDEEMKAYLIQRINTFKEILQKYKSIIGVSDDKK